MYRKFTAYFRRNICFMLITCLLVLVSCESDKSKGDNALNPIACFSTSSDSYTVGEEITFTNCSENATHYVWSFGDHSFNISTAENPKYTYTNSGAFEVILIVQNSKIKDVNNNMVYDDYDLTETNDLIKKTLYITIN